MARLLTGCPICGSGDLSPSFIGRFDRKPDGQAFPIVTCGKCTHAFINPQPTPAELSVYYDAAYEPYEAGHGVGDFDAEVRKARQTGVYRHIPIRTGLRLLDVGCGAGAFLRVAAALGAEVEGVEPSAHGVQAARSAGVPVFHGGLEEFVAGGRAGKERYDVITANHVIEHHPDPVSLLRLMGSLLKEDGYIWFGAPNAAGRMARRLKEYWYGVQAPYHLMQFSPQSARLAVEKAGLKTRLLFTESPPAVSLGSLRDIWRFRYFVPRKVSERLSFLTPLGAMVAKDMDAKGEGEAIIVEATKP